MVPQANHSPKGRRDSSRSPIGWFRPRPSPLAALFTFLISIVMVSLGSFIIYEYRSLQLQSHGKVGSVYIDNLLAPYALSYPDGVADTDPYLDHVIRSFPDESSNLLLRIWRPDGTLFYSTFANDETELHDAEDLNSALAGGFVAKLETSGVVDTNFPMSYPFFEVYAPIHDPATGELIAVGEIYQDATEILRDRTFVERAVWTAVTLTTLGVLAMLALCFSQSAELRDRLNVERKMTEQNEQLRRDADRARLEAAQANEQVLNMVGAELHDGPVQLLGLMSLMGKDDAKSDLPDGTTLRSLTQQVMTELRSMSAGLILPELEGLDAAGTVALAIERHHALTGIDVELDMDKSDIELDAPRRICLYRIIQEGLNNAARHGVGKPPKITLKRSGANLEVLIHSGPSRPATATPDMPSWRLGLQGMRRRLEPFGGTLILNSAADETKLHVDLPIKTPTEDAFI